MSTPVDRVAVDPFTAVVSEHWGSLVRLAALLMRDSAHADDVVLVHRALSMATGVGGSLIAYAPQ